MDTRKRALILGSIGGFLGGGMGAVAGSNTAWINMLVGAFGAVVVILLINGFIVEKK